MIQHIDEIAEAIDAYSMAHRGSIAKKHLLHASRAVAGITLSDGVVDILYDLFRLEDKQVPASQSQAQFDEFVSVLKSRQFHGAMRKRQMDATGFYKCCSKCYKEHILLG
eukprot:CAMPEP_0184296940 /NCGR_PEP_ID=MMETSP1049-20130417/7882_1 /TAXON_ID=77928 /ORGANISM="Proteomonas sulcata, Strain CCMP704" /LENGTH=109 /DNA_ID=CAMNT_0026606421 /DNA_START=24 /DNA_END=353 /DNA_ORIENTATION=+